MRKRVGQFVVAVLAAAWGTVATQAPAQAAPGDGWHTITTDMWTGYAIGVAGGSDADGARVITWPALYVSDQAWKWVPIDTSRRIYALLNGGTSPNKALAVSAGREDNGAPIIQYTYRASNTDQHWKLRGTLELNGSFLLENVKSEKCLAVPNGNDAKGVKLIQYDCNENYADQRWLTVDN